MSRPLAEGWQRIIERPLDYLHAERLRLPAAMDTGALRDVLDPLLVRSLGLGSASWVQVAHLPWLAFWINHWQRLPAAARLIGAWQQWPHLARGAGVQRLDASQRQFAALNLGVRHTCLLDPQVDVATRIEAAGLNALRGWHRHLPAPLNERVALLFSPDAQALLAGCVVPAADAPLLCLAVQHARYA